MVESGRRAASLSVRVLPEERALVGVVRAARAQALGRPESTADLLVSLVTAEARRLSSGGVGGPVREALDAALGALERAAPSAKERRSRGGRRPKVPTFLGR